MVFDFLQPLDDNFLAFIQGLSPQTLGKKVVFHTDTEFPNIESASIAIIGVLENRGLGDTKEIVDLSNIRKEFYSLFPGNWQTQIIDLGNIVAGESLEDTYYVLKTAIAQLIKNKVVPVVIGGSQDLTYAMYRAYDLLEQMVNVVSIDSTFDFARENGLLSESYLTKMIVDEPNNLFNYSNLGFQTYFNAQEEIDLIEKLYFDAYRLGEVCNNPTIAEPVFRDADLVSIDLSSVKSSDSGNFATFVPNGFSGKEICSLSRYAGISDKVSSFGVFNHENSKQESVLIAQIMWYFVEGFHFRSNEYPFGTKENYIKYIVTLDDELVFYKSNITERWWIEIPFISLQNNKLKKSTLLPCVYEDYLAACAGEVPERWWKAQRKNII
ncbi:Arginase family enzyme [Flavobacterium swingsii]|uniref:Arginase family enzyme n=1 Tax=Flavobacterium swingsii TaxID=498292 RepID=A0A1I0VJE1_9FLAO|nr:formimidoylglutamase [Flavobacterium swingsii]SFA76505.1 Arginase family enzyme [Flavobacterium swingsii]